MRVLIVEPGKAPYEKDIENSIDAMEAIVGGPLQSFTLLKEQAAIVCNEIGKLVELPRNRALFFHGKPDIRATSFAEHFLFARHPATVANGVLCQTSMFLCLKNVFVTRNHLLSLIASSFASRQMKMVLWRMSLQNCLCAP